MIVLDMIAIDDYHCSRACNGKWLRTWPVQVSCKHPFEGYIIVETFYKETPQGKLKCPSFRGVFLMEVFQNFQILYVSLQISLYAI